MVKKKKIMVKPLKNRSSQSGYFMGLSKSQTQSLAIGVILVGVGLFALAGYSYNNRNNLTRSILPNGASTTPTPTQVPTAIGRNDTTTTLTTPGAGSFGSDENEATSAATVTPTPTAVIMQNSTVTPSSPKEATPEAEMSGKHVTITKLPNTSSKVTYTVMKNDSVAKIGKQLCGSDRAWLSLIKTNDLVDPYTIQPGQILIITCN